MPEFVLETGDAGYWFWGQPEIVQGYVEAMFFTGCDAGDELESACVDELTREARERIRAEVLSWGHDNSRAVQSLASLVGGDSEAYRRIGRDLWFTRQGHGVGFWEHGRWPKRGAPYAAQLDRAARALGEVYPCRGDDGAIHY